jgi:hypothetical protein
MAERRMFAKTIIDSDAFLDMPLSTQALYFHLSMRADDDGFINNPKKVQRMIGCADDDLKLLIAKNFLIPFDNGVVVIKHWKIHNYIQKDRYKPTVYQEEKSFLGVKNNGAYTLDTECIHDGYSLETQDRIELELGKESIGKNNKSSKEDYLGHSENDQPKNVYPEVVEAWNTLTAYGIKPIRNIPAESQRNVMLRARFKQYGIDTFAEVIENIKNSDFLQGKTGNRPFVVTFDWVIKPSNYPKVLEGNYNNKGSNVSSKEPDYGDWQT